MDFQRLRACIVIAQEMNITRAAQRLHTAQPHLTRLLHSLEEELGFALFDRSNKRQLALTPAGQTFLTRITPLLERYEEAVQVARGISQGEAEKLRVGHTTVAMLSILPTILQEYRRHGAPEVVMRDLSTQTCQTQIQALRKGQLDAAFLMRIEPVPGIAQEWISRTPLRVVLPADHVLAKQKAIELPALAKETWVLYPRPLFPRLYDDVIALFQQAGFHPRIAQFTSQAPSIVSMVAAHAGISLLTRWFEQALPRREVVYRPLLDITYQAELHMLWRKDDSSPLVQSFLQVVREVKGQL